MQSVSFAWLPVTQTVYTWPQATLWILACSYTYGGAKLPPISRKQNAWYCLSFCTRVPCSCQWSKMRISNACVSCNVLHDSEVMQRMLLSSQAPSSTVDRRLVKLCRILQIGIRKHAHDFACFPRFRNHAEPCMIIMHLKLMLCMIGGCTDCIYMKASNAMYISMW